MLKKLLYFVIDIISYFHTTIMQWNNGFEHNFSDKELHFLVIGIIGMAIYFIVYPIFKWLAKKNSIITIAWIYTFTCIIVLTFAIEIGQKVTHTGSMEFADIMFGVVGFLLMFVFYVLVRFIFKAIQSFIQKRKEEEGDLDSHLY